MALSRPIRYLWICGVSILLFMLLSVQIDAASYKIPLDISSTASSNASIKSSYDVIVAGTDPEGITAAVSAARNGMKVLLVDKRQIKVLGGLMTLGWLNSLDLNKSPKISREFPYPYLNHGLFKEWMNYIEGTSFDVDRASKAFHKMVRDEPNIDVLLSVKSMEPIVVNNAVTGMKIVKEDGKAIKVKAGAIIDATQDADIAAAAGAPYTYAREDIGDPNVNMAVTLVIKVKGVTDAAWRELRKGHGSDSRSIWGYSGARDYESSNPTRVKMRGLNIGRQDDDTILINSMQLYGVNPLDPESIAEGIAIGQKEAPLIVEFLKKKFPSFSKLEFAGTAPELYVRESRHIIGEYRLTMSDLLANRDHWDAIAYGSYEVDIQSTAHNAPGAILMSPKQYGVPFRCLVPLEIDNLLVVGRAASYGTLAHGSARVIPLGMATGEAAGAATKLAKDRGMTFRQLSKSTPAIRELRKRLTKQGMDLRMVNFDPPKYSEHKYYKGLEAAVNLFITTGSYTNEAWELDKPSNVVRLQNSIQRLHKVYPYLFPDRTAGMAGEEAKSGEPVSLQQATYMLANAMGLDVAKPAAAQQEMRKNGWIDSRTLVGVVNKNKLTNGEVFMIIRDILEYYVGVTFE